MAAWIPASAISKARCPRFSSTVVSKSFMTNVESPAPMTPSTTIMMTARAIAIPVSSFTNLRAVLIVCSSDLSRWLASGSRRARYPDSHLGKLYDHHANVALTRRGAAGASQVREGEPVGGYVLDDWVSGTCRAGRVDPAQRAWCRVAWGRASAVGQLVGYVLATGGAPAIDLPVSGTPSRPRSLPKVIWVSVGINCGGLLVAPLALKNKGVTSLLASTGYAALISLSIFSMPSPGALYSFDLVVAEAENLQAHVEEAGKGEVGRTIMIITVTSTSVSVKPRSVPLRWRASQAGTSSSPVVHEPVPVVYVVVESIPANGDGQLDQLRSRGTPASKSRRTPGQNDSRYCFSNLYQKRTRN